MNKDQKTVLAGDIGGTKTNLGLFSMGRHRPRLETMETFLSRDYPNLERIINLFVDKQKRQVMSACFGIAGPVVEGRSKVTNLPWVISERRIKERFSLPRVCLINDLAATALAIPILSRSELYPLNTRRRESGKNIAIIAPGTGLGVSLAVFQGGEYVPIPSEGGHVDFAPRNDEEIGLWRYLNRRYGHVSIERVLSGPGLYGIYSWLKASMNYKEPAYLKKMIGDMDPAKAVTDAAIAHNNAVCTKALTLFVSVLGAVSGNLVLTGMATGGVYLGGGIPPKILPAIKDGAFINAFTDKGRFKELLEKIPVRVILNEKAALLGAAYCAIKRLED